MSEEARGTARGTISELWLTLGAGARMIRKAAEGGEAGIEGVGYHAESYRDVAKARARGAKLRAYKEITEEFGDVCATDPELKEALNL